MAGCIDINDYIAGMIYQPFPTYNGGKSGAGTYQNIINHIPKCDLFIDACTGNNSIVSKFKILPSRIILNDIDNIIYKALVDAVFKSLDNIPEETTVQVLNMDYSALIKKYDDGRAGTFFYFDPPYLISSRTSAKQLYQYNWIDSQHEEFIKRMLKMKSQVMISHYPCKMYDQAFKKWHSFTFKSTTRGGLREEKIYMNYATPSLIQDYSYVGNNFTDRQRIKRKAERLHSKLSNLPALEKAAILSTLLKIQA